MMKKIRKETLKKWMIRTTLTGFLLIAGMVLAIPWYIGSQMKRQAVESSEKLSEVYMEFLDSNVEGIQKVLSQFAAGSYDISILARSQDSIERHVAKRNVMKKLEDASMIYNVFDGIFVISESNVEDIFLCQVGQRGTGKQVEEIKEIMKDFEDSHTANVWVLAAGKDSEYLIRAASGGSTSCGVWIDVTSLSIPLNNVNYDETGTALFLDRGGNVIGRRPETLLEADRLLPENNGNVIRVAKERYLQIIKPSRILPVSMAILIPERNYIGNIYFVQNVTGLLLAVSLLFFPHLWRMLSRSVSLPVNRLIAAMNEVQKGNLETCVDSGSRFQEFDELGRDFNHMVSEISRLREDVYERKIREQKIRLQYLQAQIRPHFFLNSLNVIHSFSLVKRNDLIEQMTVCLSRYFSYRFQDPDALVSLGKEKEHMENYLELHQLRYRNQLNCHLEIEDILLDAKIPPLVIQTFVENSLKYGVSQDKLFDLELVAETMLAGKEQKLKITITDNGPGYEQEVLDDFSRDHRIKGGHGQGIGINNVVERLKLLYQEEAQVRLSNIPGAGACSEIILPLAFIEEEEE